MDGIIFVVVERILCVGNDVVAVVVFDLSDAVFGRLDTDDDDDDDDDDDGDD